MPPLSKQTHDLNTVSGAALFVLLWDIAITLDDEVAYIWPKPRNSWLKWIFLFIRYFALAAEFANRSIHMAVIYHYSLGVKAIRNWYIFQVVVAHLSMAGVEVVMMARVYALYNQNTCIGIGFITLLLAETVTVIIGVIVTLPGFDFNLLHVITQTPHSFTYFAVSAVVSQITILTLSVLKYKRGGLGRAPIVTLMRRDGTLAFIVLFVCSMAMVFYTIFDNSFAATGYAWLLSIVSIAGCRLILNMECLPSPGRFTATESLRLTTIISETTHGFNGN